MLDIQSAFAEEWGRQIARRREESPSYEVGDYVVTGRAPAPYGRRTLDYWMDKGPGLAENWLAWRREHRWQIWEAEPSLPAIELPLNFELPNGIPIVAYVDRVFVTPAGELACVDIKTGARMPDSPEQLGLYKVGIEEQYGAPIAWGYWWDANKGTHVGPFDLDKYTPQYFATLYGETAAGVNAGYFVPRPQFNCGDWCSVGRFCHATGGAEAKGVDPLAG